MNERNLSARLKKVADFVPENKVLADIGSDHGYLPVYLVLKGIISKAICGEVVEGPFLQTQKEVAKEQLEDKIQVRFGDGLEVLSVDDQVTLITICGMGGKLICDILEKGQDKLLPETDLLLQANVHESLVRTWLMNHQYEIIKEGIVRDNHKTYEIMYAKKVPEKVILSEQELFFGPLLKQEKNPIFLKKWQHHLKTHEKIVENLKASHDNQSEKIQQFEKEIQWIKEELEC